MTKCENCAFWKQTGEWAMPPEFGRCTRVPDSEDIIAWNSETGECELAPEHAGTMFCTFAPWSVSADFYTRRDFSCAMGQPA